MKILEFRKITIDDEYNDTYNDGYAWSRVYEYQLVDNMIQKHLGYSESHLIHNTSWGFTGIHVIYKENLDKQYPNCIHSDLLHSDLLKTMVLDITDNPPDNFINHFDVVINISTMEHIGSDHSLVFFNLLKQVKSGGLLICTFDLPGLQVEKFETLFQQNLESSNNDLTNLNSKLKNVGNKILECGIMVIRK